jgi:hypothetical protein
MGRRIRESAKGYYGLHEWVAVIKMNIRRKCGHVEEIAMATAKELIGKETWDANIAWAKDKYCLSCFNQLPDDTKKTLMKEAIAWAKQIDEEHSKNEKKKQ